MDATTAATDPAMTTQLELTQIGQIAINVDDLQRAIAFYRDTLGMRFLFQAPGGLAFFDVGGVRLMLGVAEKAEFSHPASILYYKVDDIDGAKAASDAARFDLGVKYDVGSQTSLFLNGSTELSWRGASIAGTAGLRIVF